MEIARPRYCLGDNRPTLSHQWVSLNFFWGIVRVFSKREWVNTVNNISLLKAGLKIQF